ncbi:MAG: GntR family transcriptional regulator [Acidobacteria bacterium]|nr:GntR family transcriptional regulator [Acidobacteriota bacterium]MBV9071343.1 GntR family transcriptional regulator [Acidobacteriota bacterium]MBV9476469.1 GntR family transcriptional regulator [Acidobacteriota bacterium]
MDDLDPANPIPLYHQIAEAVKYRIATGQLREGAMLPPLREAAASWRVNLHTVRRAYQELARQQFIELRHGSGARVLTAPVAADEPFIARTIATAKAKYGLSQEVLAARIAAWGAPRSPRALVPIIHVVECSAGQAADYAEQLRGRWNVDARPFSLDAPGEPPPGPILATYFHYNEVRERWPHRVAGLHFVAVQPDPRLARDLAPRRGKRRVVVAEADRSRAASVAADLPQLFPPERFDVVFRIVRAMDAIPRTRDGAPVFVAPRLWFALPDAVRARGDVRQLRYLIVREDLDRLAQTLGWSRIEREVA